MNPSPKAVFLRIRLTCKTLGCLGKGVAGGIGEDVQYSDMAILQSIHIYFTSLSKKNMKIRPDSQFI